MSKIPCSLLSKCTVGVRVCAGYASEKSEKAKTGKLDNRKRPSTILKKEKPHRVVLLTSDPVFAVTSLLEKSAWSCSILELKNVCSTIDSGGTTNIQHTYCFSLFRGKDKGSHEITLR